MLIAGTHELPLSHQTLAVAVAHLAVSPSGDPIHADLYDGRQLVHFESVNDPMWLASPVAIDALGKRNNHLHAVATLHPESKTDVAEQLGTDDIDQIPRNVIILYKV